MVGAAVEMHALKDQPDVTWDREFLSSGVLDNRRPINEYEDPENKDIDETEVREFVGVGQVCQVYYRFPNRINQLWIKLADLPVFNRPAFPITAELIQSDRQARTEEAAASEGLGFRWVFAKARTDAEDLEFVLRGGLQALAVFF